MRNRIWSAIAAVLILIPAGAQAQTCIGVPISAGQFAVGGEIGFPEGATSYGVIGTASLAGPISMQGRVDVYDYDEVDETTTSFGGTLAYRLPSRSAYTACPLVGANYVSEDFEDEDGSFAVSALIIPIGVGLGAALPVSGLDLSAFAVPQVLLIRSSFELDLPGFEPVSETDTEAEFGADIGLRLRTGPVFLGGSVRITSIDNTPVFSLGIGFSSGR